jgi:hypothetical protein
VRGSVGRVTAEPPVHPDLDPLAFLLGTWRGGGSGGYPTIEPFRYTESICFEHVGDPFLLYSQESWLEEGAAPLHFERGFVRPAGPGRVEAVLAHPLGLTEVAEGSLDGGRLDLASTTMGRTSTGDAVSGLVRRWRVDGDRLTYELDMEMDTTPMSLHLTGELRRT